MDQGIHFISGLPRSGSTLLASILRQNPRFVASMSSPVAGLVSALQVAGSQKNEFGMFVDDDQRRRLYRACVDAFYADVHPTKLVFDSNRSWTAKLPIVAGLFPAAKMICCVRNPAWVVDSIESLLRRNAYELSGIFGYDPHGAIYTRAEGLSKGDGMVGYAISSLREAIYGPDADRLILVRYESLVADPAKVLAALYAALGETPFVHDLHAIEQDPAMLQFDARCGTPGLHAVGSSVRAVTRPTILPPDLFERFSEAAFWDQPGQLPPHLRLL